VLRRLAETLLSSCVKSASIGKYIQCSLQGEQRSSTPEDHPREQDRITSCRALANTTPILGCSNPQKCFLSLRLRIAPVAAS